MMPFWRIIHFFLHEVCIMFVWYIGYLYLFDQMRNSCCPLLTTCQSDCICSMAYLYLFIELFVFVNWIYIYVFDQMKNSCCPLWTSRQSDCELYIFLPYCPERKTSMGINPRKAINSRNKKRERVVIFWPYSYMIKQAWTLFPAVYYKL